MLQLITRSQGEWSRIWCRKATIPVAGNYCWHSRHFCYFFRIFRDTLQETISKMAINSKTQAVSVQFVTFLTPEVARNVLFFMLISARILKVRIFHQIKGTFSTPKGSLLRFVDSGRQQKIRLLEFQWKQLFCVRKACFF